MDVLRLAGTPGMTLEVGDRKYTIEFPLPAVAKAEAKLGRSLKNPADWFGAEAKDVLALLEAGLSKHHPNVTPDELSAICDALGPEAYGELAGALGALAFPGFTARYKENLEKARAKGESRAESAVAFGKAGE